MAKERKSHRRPTRPHVPVLVEQDEDGIFIVSVPTLRGCRSYGRTMEEAMNNIAEAAVLCLEDEAPGGQAAFVGVRDLEIVAWAPRLCSRRGTLSKSSAGSASLIRVA